MITPFEKNDLSKFKLSIPLFSKMSISNFLNVQYFQCFFRFLDVSKYGVLWLSKFILEVAISYQNILSNLSPRMPHPPVFYFAILHARPTRRSPEAILVEISIPLGVCPISAVLPSNRLSSRGSVSDTTCTARSDCSDHECHLHSAVSYDGSLESPR